uniref:E2 ubiquitin-conjugating enzyme n=1 Tax=Marseillevirus LCMAC102 TaxID=2506603 RepID=A0A481YTI8_9VIRU|nr:MAG: ubiquitin-conjugating enzyme E2 [Marseillevirus LCMAC102]
METSILRLKRELQNLIQNPPPNISATPQKENFFLWDVIITGPVDTPYEGGKFKLEIYFPPEYPFQPPKINFITKIFHPNINCKGGVCLGILQDWGASLTIKTVLLTICALLMTPNPDDPLMPQIANLYKTNKSKYFDIAKKWTQEYAM